MPETESLTRFCVLSDWEALRPWLGAVLAQADAQPELLAQWLLSPPAHLAGPAMQALHALQCGPWSLVRVATDDRFSLRLHASTGHAWRLSLLPSDPSTLWRLQRL